MACLVVTTNIDVPPLCVLALRSPALTSSRRECRAGIGHWLAHLASRGRAEPRLLARCRPSGLTGSPTVQLCGWKRTAGIRTFTALPTQRCRPGRVAEPVPSYLPGMASDPALGVA